MKDWSHSWYTPGDWKLPAWWTDELPTRDGRSSHADQVRHFNSHWVVNVLGHDGGITRAPSTA